MEKSRPHSYLIGRDPSFNERLEPRPKRSWFQFGLRAAFATMVLSGLFLGLAVGLKELFGMTPVVKGVLWLALGIAIWAIYSWMKSDWGMRENGFSDDEL